MDHRTLPAPQGDPGIRTVSGTGGLGRMHRPARPGRAIPVQLPADVPAFTGRGEELAELDRLAGIGLDGKEWRRSGAAVILAVSGTAGVGKTALAIRWSHRVRAMFPDGQLYINLRGYDPDQPVLAGDALTGFLRALGVAGAEIPVELNERAARYRTDVAGRQMLIVLDNAATAEQVRPLLPGAAGCPVMVTSRDSLAGLVALHGAQRIDLGLLPGNDALTLLRELIGARVEAEPEAAAALTRYCVRLPLALRVAAGLAASRPAASLRKLAGEQGDQQLVAVAAHTATPPPGRKPCRHLVSLPLHRRALLRRADCL
jgi:hypothetical protein